MKRLVYYLVETEYGWVGIAGRDGRIAALCFPGRTSEESAAAVSAATGGEAVRAESDFSGQAVKLADYFSGKRVDFECELDFGDAGAFDLAVWNAAMRIPYGETDTYGGLAEMIGKPGAVRAVGQALGRNPIPVIVPCHRILRADGGLGGFSAGLHWKVRLLEMERRVRAVGSELER